VPALPCTVHKQSFLVQILTYRTFVQNLVELNLSACRDLEDYGITCVVRGCPLLAKLNMAHSRYVPFFLWL
jgi:hypothetical protein